MVDRSVQLHPEAVAEARAAAQWYRERNASAADAFLHELDWAIARIVESPDAWPRYIRGTRRFLLRHFPFSVVYRHTASIIEVLAVGHARRRPGYWKNRLD